jgi:hypothetical protein
VWLGLILDTIKQTVLLPEEKLRKGHALLDSWLALWDKPGGRKVTRSSLDKLIGHLSYYSMVVYGGRAFLHRIRRLRYRDERGVPRPPQHRIYCNVQMRCDLEWWQTNLAVFNGEARVPWDACGCDIRLDATGTGGLGVFVDGGFLARPPAVTRSDDGSGPAELCRGHPDTNWANDWELFAFVVLMRAYGEYLRDKAVRVVSDNFAAVRGVRKFSVKGLDPELREGYLRELFALCVRFNVRLKTRWIPGAENVLPDALSRQYWAVVSRELQHWRQCNGHEGKSAYIEMLKTL